MKTIAFCFTIFTLTSLGVKCQTLTKVLNHTETFVNTRAKKLCRLHTLPTSLDEWKPYRVDLIKRIEKQAGIYDNTSVPLLLKVHNEQQLDGYKVQNITFQVREGVFATANLFIPNEKGLFPAVLNLHGHTAIGRFDADVQYRSHKLAKNGFVCLSIDTWGAGERTTQHGVFEYHGGNLGANLLNIGETLLGAQLMDNRRAVDLLTSLDFVDKNNIGVTGESGGGNQTMWVAALDKRLKAAIPVVSVGTFEAYAMGHNCVCELLPKGMILSEESGIVSLVAPRHIRLYSAKKEANAAFMPAEMLKTFRCAESIFTLYNAPKNISYQLFDAPHSYSREMADSMVVWFGRVLKNVPSPVIQPVSYPIDEAIVAREWVFEKGLRPVDVKSIATYCAEKSRAMLSLTKSHSKSDLYSLFSIKDTPFNSLIDLKKNKEWQLVELFDGHRLPIYISTKGSPKQVVLHLFNHTDVTQANEPNTLHIWIGLFGKSEQTSSMLKKYDDDVSELHTMARSNLWAGESSIGIWYSEIKATTEALKRKYPRLPITIKTEKEIAIAALLSSVIDTNIKAIETTATPLTYVFDIRSVGFDKGYMGSHIPAFLQWGDVADLAALSNASLTFTDSRSFAGRKLDPAELASFSAEYQLKRKRINNNSTLSIH